MSLIAVDMTPVFPQGLNGGAKIFSLELLKSFQTRAPKDNFLILTASWNHKELSILDNKNMNRLCILKQPNPHNSRFDLINLSKLKKKLLNPAKFMSKHTENIMPAKLRLNSLGVDLLFCPFTAPTYAEPGIPVISVIYDLQHLTYPQFFDPKEIITRQTFFNNVQKKADIVVCISEYVRQCVLQNLNMDPQKTYVSPICIQSRFPKLESSKVKENLLTLGINQHQYIFYPANFWPHKNHQMLLTAFSMFLSRNPNCKIKLVFTGTIDDMEARLKAAVQQMGLKERVHFLGYLGKDKLSSVWQGCEFLIFPSLYEGFGIPLLEAMFFKKAILCSNTTSFPETAQDTALYFDPRNPREIVDRLEQVINNSVTKKELIERGSHHILNFRHEEMTKKYLELFDLAIQNHRLQGQKISGLYKDGWIGEELIITSNSENENQYIQLQLEAPPFLPSAKVRIKSKSSDGISRKWKIQRGAKLSIRHPLPEYKSNLIITVNPTFRPSNFGMGEDQRQLGVICQECDLITPTEKKNLISQGNK